MGGLQIMSKLTETTKYIAPLHTKKQKPSSKPSKGKITLHWHHFNSFICLIISACYNTCHDSLIQFVLKFYGTPNKKYSLISFFKMIN